MVGAPIGHGLHCKLSPRNFETFGKLMIQINLLLEYDSENSDLTVGLFINSVASFL